MRTIATLLVIALLSSLSLIGCGTPNIYPDNPWDGAKGPVIQHIAVAPFLIHDDIASTMHTNFDVMSFTTSDGATATYSTDVAKIFADALSEFPDMVIESPERVERAWMATKASGEELNPMATRKDAMELARTMDADAILVATLVSFDPYERPKMLIHWSMYYTRGGQTNAEDVRRMEQQGTGGTMDSAFDPDRVPMYTNQLTVDLNTLRDQDLLEEWGEAMDTPEPFKSQLDAITKEAYPSLIRFAAWVAMTNAMRYQRKTHSGAPSNDKRDN